jgi:hypothetical protein
VSSCRFVFDCCRGLGSEGGRPANPRERRGGGALHVEHIADEFLQGFETVGQIAKPAVTIFGSARVDGDHPAYTAAVETGKRAAAGVAMIVVPIATPSARTTIIRRSLLPGFVGCSTSCCFHRKSSEALERTPCNR